MQTVQTFIKTLGFGVLKNLSGRIVDEDTNEIQEKALPEIIHWINEGLTFLYTQYEIKDSVLLQIHESRTLYPLRAEYQMTDDEYASGESAYDKYLWKGFEEKFTDNIMQIRDVITHEGMHLPLNDQSNRWSAFTPQFDTVELPSNLPSGMVSIVYRAKCPDVSYEENTVIQLPPYLYDALANYVAYKIHSGMNTESSVANANKYRSEFSHILQNAIDNGVIETDYQPDFRKFYLRGFV